MSSLVVRLVIQTVPICDCQIGGDQYIRRCILGYERGLHLAEYQNYATIVQVCAVREHIRQSLRALAYEDNANDFASILEGISQLAPLRTVTLYL